MPDPSGPPPAPQAGFVGTGMMGVRMAGRLLDAGVALVVYNRSHEKALPLLARGARWAARPAEVATAVPRGIVFLMLSDGPAVRSVLFGRGGLARAASPGLLIVDHSTIDPEESRRIAARLSSRGIHYLDAPVGGSIGPAERGELTFFVGGDDEDLARARPFLDRVGRRIEHLGPTGTGTSMKLVNNLLTIGTVALLSEALAAGEAMGLDRARMVDLLRRGGGASAMLEGKHRNLVERKYPGTFLTGLARKDLALLERAARRVDRPAPMSRGARCLLEQALREGHGNDDFSSIAETARQRRIRAGTNGPAVGMGAGAAGQ